MSSSFPLWVLLALQVVVAVDGALDSECYKNWQLYASGSKSPPACSKVESPMDRFKRMDTNKDNKLSLQDFNKFDKCSFRFNELSFCSGDVNKDGFLSKKEFMGNSTGGFWDEFFNTWAGTDSKLNFTEFVTGHTSLYGSFSVADSNADGTITQDEYKSFFNPATIFAKFDKNKDGKLGKAEMTTYLTSIHINPANAGTFISKSGALKKSTIFAFILGLPNETFPPLA